MESNFNKILKPNVLLKRISFLFLNKSKMKIWLKNAKNTSSLKRIEKQKTQQKKRRRKKQARENRRRKKRKRFYPRPIWLRFNFYKRTVKVNQRFFFFFF